MHWNQTEASEDLIHIHGEKDTVFPIKNLSKPFIKIKGGHAAILTEANWFNDELPKILLENLSKLVFKSEKIFQ